ncbi:MAG: glucose-1-phosphate adenylyltransferase [Mogibacterium sp.]|nr:glucose-1-phosphate adenylyltransferase [Mogibacterium sp.]
MMKKKKMIAMLLAGGQGSRLGSLTSSIAKPAVSFGGKYRIIDFGLSNCKNSGIDTVGILVQYKPLVLNKYVGTGESWDMAVNDGGVHILPPYAGETGGEWYEGTADAIYHNIDFIDMYDPENVLILSGDHIYKMDYKKMLKAHTDNNADLTVSVIEVPWEEASRFGIMTADEEGRIVKFSEKPKEPDSNLASMGIYIFSWKALRKALLEDHADKESSHDFGKDIIPKMLAEGQSLHVYRFEGYWRDVGTVKSYYDSQMDLMDDLENINVFNRDMRVFSNSNMYPPQYLGPNANIGKSMICNGCTVYGTVKHSIIGSGAVIGDGTVIEDSIVLPNAWIGRNCRITKAIINEGTIVEDNAVVGSEDGEVIVHGNARLTV